MNYIVSRNGTITATLIENGKAIHRTIHKDTPFYEDCLKAAKARNVNKFVAASNFALQVSKQSKGAITYENGILMGGRPLHSSMAKRFNALIHEGHSVKPFILFMENVYLNPSQSAIDELYLFLEANDLPMTEDGHLLAYRCVNRDYTSKHPNPDGTHNRNKVGDYVTKDRAECDPDRNRTCSRGLHACSLGYIPQAYTNSPDNRIMIVKINPKDVVSIPTDYNNQKMRCCAYKVVAEHMFGDSLDGLEHPVYSEDEFGIKPSGQKFYNRRSSTTGRFTK